LQDPEAIVQVNYRPILSSERALHIKKPAIGREIKLKLVRGPRWAPDTKTDKTGRLTVGHKLNKTSTSTSIEVLEEHIAFICRVKYAEQDNSLKADGKLAIFLSIFNSEDGGDTFLRKIG
jgi:hypothetical protein